MRRWLFVPTLLAVLCSPAALGAGKALSIAFTGDNGGEVAPCG